MSRVIKGASRSTRGSGGSIQQRVAAHMAQLKALKQSTCKHESRTRRDGRWYCLNCEVAL